jgi:hypothetical protein
MKIPKMYLLLVKKPSADQAEIFRAAFRDFAWSQGFAVEEIVTDEIVNGDLLIQFLSFKEFFQKNEEFISLNPDTVESVLTGKGQFFGALYSQDIAIEEKETYFVYLGEASESRAIENEAVYQVELAKYSDLKKMDLSLENVLNS